MFKHRGIVVTPEDFSGVNWIQLLKDHGLNTLGIHSGGGAGHDVLRMLGRFGSDEFRQEVTDAGLEYEYECHASDSLLPRTLFADSPELFPFDAKCVARVVHGNGCVSNPRYLEIIETNAEKLAGALPSSTHRYFFWGADEASSSCHCPQCAHLSVSDQYLMFVNAIARGARRADAQAVVPYLAYYETWNAPREVNPESNVILEYAPMYRCYLHPLNDRSCSLNRRYCGQLSELCKVFDARRGHVLEYFLDSSSFSGFKKPAVPPVFRKDVVRNDLDFYRELGFDSLTTFAVYMDGEYFRRHGDRELCEYAELCARPSH